MNYIEIEKDIKGAINLMEGNNETSEYYKRVKIFPDYSLKFFKKYKIDNRKILTKINCLDEVFDLLSYNANLTAFSTNRLDEYMINLLLEIHKLDRQDYFSFIFKDNDKGKRTLSEEIYKEVCNNLDDKTRYFFDELYNYANKKSARIYKITQLQKYPKEIYQMYIRHYISKAYSEFNNYKYSYINTPDEYVTKNIKNGIFNFLNLSYDLDKLSENERNILFLKINEYSKLLTENGKIQSFVSRENINIPNHTVYEERSILTPYVRLEESKKDYAYMYRLSK